MRYVNRVTILGKANSFKKIDDSYATMSVLTEEVYKDKQGAFISNETWHLVKIRNKFLIESLEKSFKKLCYVYVSGKLNKKKANDVEIAYIDLGPYDKECIFIKNDDFIKQENLNSTKDDIPF